MGYYYYSRKNLKTDLNSAIKSGNIFTELKSKNGDNYKYFDKLSSAQTAIKIAGQQMDSPIFLSFVNDSLIDRWLFERPKQYGWWSQSSELPNLIELFSNKLFDKNKKKIVEFFLNNYSKFYSYIRKYWLSFIVPWITEEKDALEIITKCSKTLLPDQLEILTTKLSDGEENVEVKKVLEKHKVLKYSMMSETEINSNPELRKQFIKDVAKSVSIAKKAKFPVQITLDELKDLPPITRFDFLSKILTYEIYYSKSNYWRRNKTNQDIYLSIQNRKKALKYDNIKIPDLSAEEMKELVFAATIRHNESVAKFISGYEEYLKIVEDVNKTQKSESN